MTTSRRIRACALPAAALAAALVLTPAAAFAADGDVPASSSVVAEGPDATTTVSPAAEAGVAESLPVSPSAAEAGAAESVPVAPGAETTLAADGEAAPSEPEVVAPVAPTPSAAPEVAPEDGGDEVVVDAPEVFSQDGSDLHPGFASFFGTVGFTPGDEATVGLVGSQGEDLSSWIRPAPGLTFSIDGDTTIIVVVPNDAAVPDIVTLNVFDESGNEASLEIRVSAFVVAPHLEAPVSATAGVVSVQGENGEPGQVALVSVVDASLVESLEPDQGSDEGVADEADGVELVRVAEDEAPADDPGFVTDEEPIAFDPEEGVAFTLVPIDETGHFTASFVLPAGDYVSDAAVLRRDGSAASDFSVPVQFSVAAAAPVLPVPTAPAAVVPTAVAPVAVVPVRTTRPAGLAYTGSDASAWLVLAAGLVAAGSVAVAASRLRGRRS
ncbi:hypothetical protein EDF18_3213 [Frigoribacterium sp. PhB107]|uniref:hypothetical protein n=1 Tax=Frigoribacterium sp. PhB107 TaxID=2485172 RepID=UPI000F4AD752|nr:hypothetical protein [Frigoribacterium sp. PhB107]ROP72988.1 hypothetical protein EDF18_3213 [Frigoribacterium sp. PhB107]